MTSQTIASNSKNNSNYKGIGNGSDKAKRRAEAPRSWSRAIAAEIARVTAAGTVTAAGAVPRGNKRKRRAESTPSNATAN
jgi:hypothetical protein